MQPTSLDRAEAKKMQEAGDQNEPDIIIGSREQLFHLMAEAAEIEHTLLCSYLYAAFSLKQGGMSGLSESEAEAVERWRKMIMEVAIEEMGHLLIVANLTVAIGGRPHFTRPNFPVSPGYFPSGVVLRLTPFDLATLDHFIFLERPTGVERPDGTGFENAEHERTQAHRDLMPSAQEYATVSHLYEAIRANLIAFVERSGEESLFIGPRDGQIGPEIFKMLGVECIGDLESACHAIDLIVEQGEGSSADSEDSHYRRFQTVKREYIELAASNSDFAPAYRVAENPVMRRPLEPEGKVFIDGKPAAMVLDFANAVYGMLLRFLVQAYTKTGALAAPDKERMLSAAVDLMHVMATAASALVKQSASPGYPGLNAGMTFTMLRGVEPFIGGTAEKALIAERLDQLAAGAKRIGRVVPEISPAAERLEEVAARFR